PTPVAGATIVHGRARADREGLRGSTNVEPRWRTRAVAPCLLLQDGPYRSGAGRHHDVDDGRARELEIDSGLALGSVEFDRGFEHVESVRDAGHVPLARRETEHRVATFGRLPRAVAHLAFL